MENIIKTIQRTYPDAIIKRIIEVYDGNEWTDYRGSNNYNVIYHQITSGKYQCVCIEIYHDFICKYVDYMCSELI